MKTITSDALTIPNALSLYRLLSLPVVLYFAYQQQLTTFTVLLAINLFTDILDGALARYLDQRTLIGARLDSTADAGMYLSAVVGIYVFKAADVAPHLAILWAFLAGYVISWGISLMRFGKVAGLHLYSFKTAGYLQGTFLVWWMAVGFEPVWYYIALGVGVLACIEQIVLLLMLPRPIADIGSLYHYLTRNRHAS